MHLIRWQIIQNSFLCRVAPAGSPGPDLPWVSMLEDEEVVACFPPASSLVGIHPYGHVSEQGPWSPEHRPERGAFPSSLARAQCGRGLPRVAVG